MSLGIPSLYIATKESELFNYTKKYKHAKCFRENELDKAMAYILKMNTDKKLYNKYAENSLIAAKDFTLKNVDQIIDLYLKEENND